MEKIITYEQGYALQQKLLSGILSDEEIIAIFEDLEKEGLNIEMLKGIIDASLEVMVKVDTNLECLDTCGTGGDSLQTFNISTLATIVCAACGVNVAKHGNRAISSKCGSADILEALGVKVDLNAAQAKKCLETAGIVFMLAPQFHPAFKHVAAARKQYGKRTYFNFIGPLLNPANAKFQLIGVSDSSRKAMLAEVLRYKKTKRAFILSSAENLDEISLSSATEIYDVQIQQTNKFTITPEDFGFVKIGISEIKGGDIQLNKEIFLNVLQDKATAAQNNIVILNAAAGLAVAGFVPSIEAGIPLAQQAITSGQAVAKLNQFIKISNEI